METKQTTNLPKEKAVNLTWTWYLFLIANVLLIVGIAISWGLFGHAVGTDGTYISIVTCNCAAMILIAIFYFFDAREIYLVRQHVPKKNFIIYFAAGFVFILNLIFIIVYLLLIDSIMRLFDKNVQINATFGIWFGVSALISLISVGLYRYAKFKIDLTLLRRRRGETLTEQQPTVELPKEDTPTAGLTSNADQE